MDKRLAKMWEWFYKYYRFTILIAVINLMGVKDIFAQIGAQPYSFQFYQKLDQNVNSVTSPVHTSLKPFLVSDSALNRSYDSLLNYSQKGKQTDTLNPGFFNRHLIDYRSHQSSFYTDFLPDFEIGRDFAGSKTTNLSSLGFQLGGTSGSKFYYNISGYASSAIFPGYLDNYINQVGIIPGQAYNRTPGQNPQWYYVTGIASYAANQYLSINAGVDKTFIGDGYRSMLLSDYASPYPFLKLIATVGRVQYMVMWTNMNDPATTSQYGIQRRKFGVFHYLDINISKSVSVGFFENITGFYTDDNGQKRPFDFNYINPVIYLNPINNASNDPDKSLLGFTAKYNITNKLTAYGQFALDEFYSTDFFANTGSYANKYGWQLGIKGQDLFHIKSLNFLIETNTAKPYTYSARSAIENYSENGEPLAHPWGANFREVLGLLNYSYKRFDFSFESDFGRYGLDENGLNYGNDIFEVYTSAARLYGNYTTQGLTTNMAYLEEKVAYIINPKYNLRIEFDGIYRVEENSQFTDRTKWLTVGLKSSFRQLYNDISNFKSH
jgi:hypothetical protein